MSRFLFDVSLMLAVLDSKHQFHDRAFNWLRAVPDARRLTSPIVQNGVLRVASQPSYPSRIWSTAEVRAVLRDFCADPRHEFCPDDISLLDDGHLTRPEALTPGRVADLYLAALARQHGARLATFARRIPEDAFAPGDYPVHVIPG